MVPLKKNSHIPNDGSVLHRRVRRTQTGRSIHSTQPRLTQLANCHTFFSTIFSFHSSLITRRLTDCAPFFSFGVCVCVSFAPNAPAPPLPGSLRTRHLCNTVSSIFVPYKIIIYLWYVHRTVHYIGCASLCLSSGVCRDESLCLSQRIVCVRAPSPCMSELVRKPNFRHKASDNGHSQPHFRGKNGADMTKYVCLFYISDVD